MSVVISQVAPGIGHNHHHPIMVGGGSHPDETSHAPRRDSRERSGSSASSSLRAPPFADIPPEPRSPAIQPRNAQSSSSQATPVASTRPHIQEPTASGFSDSTWSSSATLTAASTNQQNRGYDQSGFPLSSEPGGLAVDSPNSPRLHPTYRSTRSLGGSEATSPSRIKVRDLSHIQSFASEEMLNRPRIRHRSSDVGTQYEISAMPVADIIEMVAGLLTRITTTNDQQHDYVHRPIPSSEEQANMNPQSSCVLAFHGKNVPSITILSYLSRIHKYCPTTYEVFLSLLVYFDRMTEMVNKGFLDASRPTTSDAPVSPVASPSGRSPLPRNIDGPALRTGSNNPTAGFVNTPPASGSMEPVDQARSNSVPTSPTIPGQTDLSQFFVVDSYNIHRLVIAGVTCASKFFSDVFYTNSRYAKVIEQRCARRTKLTCIRLAACPLMSSITSSFNFYFLTIFDSQFPLRSLKLTEPCLSSSTLERLLHNSKLMLPGIKLKHNKRPKESMACTCEIPLSRSHPNWSLRLDLALPLIFMAFGETSAFRNYFFAIVGHASSRDFLSLLELVLRTHALFMPLCRMTAGRAERRRRRDEQTTYERYPFVYQMHLLHR